MLHKLRPLIILLIIAGVGGGVYWALSNNPALLTKIKLQLGLLTPAEAAGVYLVSGYIEADEVSVSAQTGGKINAILVDEGDPVQAGQTVALLDTALLDAQTRQAEAAIDTAQAQLAKVEAGVRAEEIAQAEAAVAAMQANAQAAHTRWQDAITLRDNPQELDVQIEAAQTALDMAGLQISAAIPAKDATETRWDLRQQQWEYVMDEHRKCISKPEIGVKKCFVIEFPEGAKQDAGVAWNYAGADMWEAWVNLNTAVTQQDNTQTRLNDLQTLRNNPQEAQVQVAQAQAAYQSALAAVEVAQAQLDLLKAGPRSEQIALAQSQVAQTQADLDALSVLRDKLTLTAPMTGWVVKKIANAGEVAVPRSSLLTVANLNDLTLTVYVPEPDVGLVSLGQQVNVYVDSFPGEAFTGIVTTISDQAEFTPKNVQTKEERANTVFAVKIKLQNKGLHLKPGMPADAAISGQYSDFSSQ
ncbi:MAG: efflux RND transporter periplasmic adaptor subunit [Anaerolineae bacterium]|nr:efflux RND transporter periplasmic adaptor subunit [Anaerolineae bacterium]